MGFVSGNFESKSSFHPGHTEYLDIKMIYIYIRVNRVEGVYGAQDSSRGLSGSKLPITASFGLPWKIARLRAER